jgi:streptogramin lyase
LTVSSSKRGFGKAHIDTINRDGQVLKTLTDSNRIQQLRSPFFLYTANNCIFVADAGSDVVLKVGINTGRLIDTLSHPALKGLREVKVDTAGNMLVANRNSQAVVVCSPGKEWKTLPLPNNSQGYNDPNGVCLTNSGRLIVAWNQAIGRFRTKSIVTVYDL